MRAKLLIGWGLLMALVALPGYAQQPDTARHWSDDAWTPIIEEGGVAFSYIFYREANSYHNGVVVRLINRNDYPVRYAFTIIFRAGDGQEKVDQARGTLEAGAMKTGDASGLYWIPFRDERRIGEVGLRGIRIERAGTSGTS